MALAVQQRERRGFVRKPCNLPVALDDYDNAYSGNIRNLGKGGAFVQATFADRPEIGREFIITIPYCQNESYLIIKAKVAWAKADGIGVTFTKSGLLS